MICTTQTAEASYLCFLSHNTMDGHFLMEKWPSGVSPSVPRLYSCGPDTRCHSSQHLEPSPCRHLTILKSSWIVTHSQRPMILVNFVSLVFHGFYFLLSVLKSLLYIFYILLTFLCKASLSLSKGDILIQVILLLLLINNVFNTLWVFLSDFQKTITKI